MKYFQIDFTFSPILIELYIFIMQHLLVYFWLDSLIFISFLFGDKFSLVDQVLEIR